jgi:hypothetical protein
MTQTDIPQCIDCANLVSISNRTCKAFPEGIPEEILTWRWDHINPFPGDNGIRFVPIEE